MQSCECESGEQKARVNGESNRDNVISAQAQCSHCQSGEANDWRNREPLEQVITLRER